MYKILSAKCNNSIKLKYIQLSNDGLGPWVLFLNPKINLLIVGFFFHSFFGYFNILVLSEEEHTFLLLIPIANKYMYAI